MGGAVTTASAMLTRARTGRPVLLVWMAWLWVMAGANMATALYDGYASRFGFSSLLLTLVFATYAALLVPSLLLFGRLSDRLGRRPVMLAGMAAACCGLVLFALARGTGWLFAARACQGLAVGLISGPATAALVELDVEGPPERPALLAGWAQAGGSGLGPLVAGALVQWGPAPTRLTYLLGLGGTLLTAAGITTMRDGGPRTAEPWRVQRPRVPATARAAFARTSLTAAVCWASVGIFLSVVPRYARTILHTRDVALLALVAAVGLAASCVTQGLGRRRADRRRAQATGLALVAVGLAGLAVGAPTGSLAVLVTASIVVGAGHGLAVLAAQADLNDLAPADRRGEVTAAFICCIYATLGTAVTGTGLLAVVAPFAAAVATVAGCLAVAAGCLAAWHLAAHRR
jgi:MFS family permease